MCQREEQTVLDQQGTNSKGVEFDGFKKDILEKVKEVLGK